MNSLTRALFLLSAAGALIPAFGQSHPAVPAPLDVTIINPPKSEKGDTTVVNVYEIFVNNAPQSFHVAGAPRFAIEGKDGKFYLGIGGTAKTTLSYDWGNPIDIGYDFTTSAIPFNLRKGDGTKVQFSAATSGLFLNFVAMPGSKNQLGVYIDFNLTGNGNDYGFNLYYAYLKYRGFTVGYNFSLFTDLGAAPPSIDFEGPNSLTAIPNTVIDYSHSFGPHWSVAAGLEKPMVSATVSDKSYVVSQRVPDIPVYVQYAWGGGKNRVRLSGILRNMAYRDIPADRNRYCTGWGVKLSGTLSPASFITAYYQAAYGKGITSYFQDLYEGALDMVPGADGRLRSVKAWGGYVGLQFNLSRTVYATATYSHLRDYAPRYNSASATPWDSQYKYAQYALANIMWNITPRISTGLEYIYGRRVDMNGASRHDNRLQTMLQVTF